MIMFGNFFQYQNRADFCGGDQGLILSFGENVLNENCSIFNAD